MLQSFGSALSIYKCHGENIVGTKWSWWYVLEGRRLGFHEREFAQNEILSWKRVVPDLDSKFRSQIRKAWEGCHRNSAGACELCRYSLNETIVYNAWQLWTQICDCIIEGFRVIKGSGFGKSVSSRQCKYLDKNDSYVFVTENCFFFDVLDEALGCRATKAFSGSLDCRSEIV